MDPFNMKTVGEEWARDRQQRRERETGRSGPTIGTRSVVQILYAQLRKLARWRATPGLPEREAAATDATAMQ